MPDPAFLDPLTSLRNRGALDHDLADQLAIANASGDPLALVAFDLDRFKQVNDEHGGHVTGDEALKAVADITQRCASGKGTPYRHGGDEFAVILPNHTTQEALAFAERLRRAVNAAPLTSRQLTLSISVGVAVAPEHGSTADALMKSADTAHYDSKNRGRNLVRFCGEPAPVSNTGAREPERKQPEAGQLTTAQRDKIRTDFFRRRVARCPHDDAILHVEDVTAQPDPRNVLLISCPLCGLGDRLN
jgi:diguanylate cyclase (GGDEF)-like protein